MSAEAAGFASRAGWLFLAQQAPRTAVGWGGLVLGLCLFSSAWLPSAIYFLTFFPVGNRVSTLKIPEPEKDAHMGNSARRSRLPANALPVAHCWGYFLVASQDADACVSTYLCSRSFSHTQGSTLCPPACNFFFLIVVRALIVSSSLLVDSSSELTIGVLHTPRVSFYIPETLYPLNWFLLFIFLCYFVFYIFLFFFLIF